MAGNNKQAIDSRRWPGVLLYASATKRFGGRPDQCYYIRYSLPDGKKRLEKVGWKSESYTPQIAAQIRSDRILKLRHGEEVKTARELALAKQMRDRTLDEVSKTYFEACGESLKGLTTDKNRYEIHLGPFLGKRSTGSISPLDIDRIKMNMRDKSPATVANALELLRRLLNFGRDKNLCPPLPFIIKMPKKDNTVTEFLEKEEAERLLKILDAWPSQDISRMLKLAILTGLRRGEIFKLRDPDLDFLHRIITLPNPKGVRTVSIPMSEPVRELLEIQQKWRNKKFPGSLYLFPGKNGARRTDSSAVDRIKREANLPNKFRIFHGLRHHFAVMLANSGEFTLDMIGELLTHKSHAMTQRYAQFLPGTVQRAANRAADLLLNNVALSRDEKLAPIIEA